MLGCMNLRGLLSAHKMQVLLPESYRGRTNGGGARDPSNHDPDRDQKRELIRWRSSKFPAKHLPEKILARIFSFLSGQDAAQAARVCKLWWKLIRTDDWIWKGIYLRQFKGGRHEVHGHLHWKEVYKMDHKWHNWKLGHRSLEAGVKGLLSIELEEGRVTCGGQFLDVVEWDIENETSGRVFDPPGTRVMSLGLYPDHIVSGSTDCKAKLWSRKWGRCLWTMSGHLEPICCVSFDGHRILSGSLDCTIMEWDVASRRKVQVLEGHASGVRCLDDLGNGKLLSGSSDKSIKLWDLETGGAVSEFLGHDRGVKCIEAAGHLIGSGSYDSTVKVWDLRSTDCVNTFECEAGNGVVTLFFDGTFLISGSWDQLRVWDIRSGLVRKLDVEGGGVCAVKYDGKRIVCAVNDLVQNARIEIWEV